MACLSLIFYLGLITSVGIGIGNAGNDLCNAMGVTVGAKVLPLRHAVAVGALFDGLGGLLMGSRVTNTISSGIVNPSIYAADPSLLAKAMLVVMFSGGATMLTGTFGRVPISAHHSVVGSLVAVACITKGPGAVHWELVYEIVFSWIGNPLLGMLTSFAIFVAIDALVLQADEPVTSFGRYKWALYLLSFQACLPFVLTKSPQIDVGGGTAVLISCLLALLFAAFSPAVLRWLALVRGEEEEASSEVGLIASQSADGSEDADDADAEAQSGAPAKAPLGGGLSPHTSSSGDALSAADEAMRSAAGAAKQRAVEEHFCPLLILSALSVAFVHGAQDVSNAAGPLMQIVATVKAAKHPHSHKEVPRGADADVDGAELPWPLLLGVGAFVLGDLTLGSKVIVTVGSKITDMTPSRAFAAQMGTVVALTSATLLALPVSTSECIVGSVIGVGLAKKFRAYDDAGLNFQVLKKIWAAWLLTIPYAATIAAIFYGFVQLLCSAF